MKGFFHTPPKLALWMLKIVLPEHIKDDITGDLEEEFHYSRDSDFGRYIFFWNQTITTCSRYAMTKRNILTMALMIVSAFLFITMFLAVSYLANGDDESIYSQSYWTNGAVHMFFAESLFWQSFTTLKSYDVTLGLFINIPSLIWASTGLLALLWLDSKSDLSLKAIISASCFLLLFPYLSGVTYFNILQIPLREAGPVIAFMWLPILYLIFPLCVVIVRKIRQPDQKLTA